MQCIPGPVFGPDKDAQRYIGASCNKKRVVGALLLDQLAKCFHASTEKNISLFPFQHFVEKLIKVGSLEMSPPKYESQSSKSAPLTKSRVTLISR